MKRFRLFLSLLVVLLFASSAFASPFMVLPKRGSAWSGGGLPLAGWDYRKEFTATRESGAVTDYQVKILVGESSGATGEDVDCGGHVLSTFNDLRFTTSDGTTLLPYWIESITGTTPNQLATVWVKLDSVGTSATTFYMYYGKAGASAASNGANTFIFHDHFDGDLSKWSGDTASVSVSESIATLQGAGKAVYSPSYSGDIALRARAKLGAYNHSQIGLSENPIIDDYIQIYYSVASPNASRHDSVKGGANTNYSNLAGGFGEYRIYDVMRYLSGTDTARSYVDGVQAGTGTTANVPTVDLAAHMRCVTSSSVTVACDWILVRHYVESEPVVGSWGSEES